MFKSYPSVEWSLGLSSKRTIDLRIGWGDVGDNVCLCLTREGARQLREQLTVMLEATKPVVDLDP